MLNGEGAEFVGKYRGIVSNNQDPWTIGRVRARVPEVTGDDETDWALPCAPFGGSATGFFAVPAVGALVWIEFEHGDVDHPIWTGCFWGSKEDVPPLLQSAPDQKVVIQTQGGLSIVLDDSAGGEITLQTSGGQKLTITANGIEIDDGNGATISLTGGSVKINDDGLVVT